MRTTKLRAAVLGSVATVVLAGCGGGNGGGGELAGSWEEIVEAAESEGSVTLYSTHSPQNLESLKVAFEAEYPGISLEYVRGTDADLLPRVDVERETGVGEADVHMTTDGGWIQRSLDSGGGSAEIVGPDFDEPDYQRDESVIEDKFFVTSATIFGLGWNTQSVPEGLSDPQDVLDDQFSGLIGITNPNGIPTYVDMYRKIDDDFGPGFLEDLAQYNPRVYQSAVAITQALASGEVLVTPTAANVIDTEKRGGAPVDFALPDDPFGVPWYSHVLESAPNPNAAQVLANFLVTQVGQEMISADYIAALPDIEGTGVEGSDVLAQDVELADPETLDQDSVNEYQAWWESLFTG